MSPHEAEAAIRSHVTPLAGEATPLTALAGCILRESIVASRDQPPFDRVTMDGIAFAHAAYVRGRREFRIAGTQAAGTPPLSLETEEHCIEVMTGATLPRGCDCVVPVEKIEIRGGEARLTAEAAPERNGNVHPRG